MKKMSQKENESFNRWLLLDDDNLNLDEIKVRISDLPKKILNATEQLEEYYQLFFLSQSVQMVIGGLKPMTSITIDHSLIMKYKQNGLIEDFDFNNLHKIMFEMFGVKVQEKNDIVMDKSYFLLINPDILTALHEKYPQLIPYRDENIYEWMQKNIENGINEDFLNGILFGYPISSVKQFVKYQNDEACRYIGRTRISSYGESYLVWGEELKRDVSIREKVKDSFFTKLAADKIYLELTKDLDNKAKKYRQISKDLFEDMIYSLQVSRDIKNS